LGEVDSSIIFLPKNYTSFCNLTDVYYDSYKGNARWMSASNKITESYDLQYRHLKNINLNKKLVQFSARQQSLIWYQRLLKKNSKCEVLTRALKEFDISNQKLVNELSLQPFPTLEDIGKEGRRALFLLIQHFDEDIIIQENFLSKIKVLIESSRYTDTILLNQYAYLTDRVLVNKGKDQEFGTQSKEDGTLFPIRDITKVNERRHKFYLKPILVTSLTNQ